MILSAENITKRYLDGESERTILQDVSVEFEDKNCHILVGPSGSGKSTLLYLLSTLREPTSGLVKLNNDVISSRKNAEAIRYEQFGFIFQQAFLLPYLTAKENICIARKDRKLSALADAWLEKFKMSNLSQKYPHQLSGGERQRVAIIRALIKKPSVIFADEPTASLDRENAKIVFNALKQEVAGSILIVATHDLSLLNGDEKIYEIADKTIKMR